MATAYQNPLEAKTALTSAFNPTNQAQIDAIARASALVPTISTSSLAPATPYTLPTSEPDTTHYPSLIADGNARIASGITTGTTDTSTKTNQTDLQKQLNDLVSGTSSTDLYNTARTNAGLDTAQADALAKRNAVRAAQAELAGVQAQIQAVQDSAKQQNLQLEQNATGGLITTNFLDRQQQEINRQAAIAALPLQALALSAQAKVASLQGDEIYAQSTLKAAQDKLDTTFKLMSDDATRKQNLQLKIFDTMYQDFTAKEKAKADAIKEQTARNQANLMDVRNAAQTAFQTSDDKSLYAQFVQIPIPDVTSKTFTTDFQAYNEKVATLQAQIAPKVKTGTTKTYTYGGKVYSYKVDANGTPISTPTEVGGNTSGGGIAKGSLSDKAFVNKVLSAHGVSYADALTKVPKGTIGVIDNATGQAGTIDSMKEFDSSKYTLL